MNRVTQFLHDEKRPLWGRIGGAFAARSLSDHGEGDAAAAGSREVGGKKVNEGMGQGRQPAWATVSAADALVITPADRFHRMLHVLVTFLLRVPSVMVAPSVCVVARPDHSAVLAAQRRSARQKALTDRASKFLAPLHSRFHLIFPDKRLIQYDCGKLQTLAGLLQKLKPDGHRCLIFTQMTRMLDVLEAFLNIHGHSYLRLDGSTKPNQRQLLMTRFNADPKYFCFILATRAGGVGINLTGADTVIFYDSDWNPAMDAQAQDRAHRIGQTRDVHIYRLVTEQTIEENILKKSNQKRLMDSIAIQAGAFNVANVAASVLNRDTQQEDVSEPSKSGNLRVAADEEGVVDEEDMNAAEAQRQEEDEEAAEFNEEGGTGGGPGDGEGRDGALELDMDMDADGDPDTNDGGTAGRKKIKDPRGVHSDQKKEKKKREEEEEEAGVEALGLSHLELLALDWARANAPEYQEDAIDNVVKEYEQQEFDMVEIEARRRAMDLEMDADPEGVMIEDWPPSEAIAMYKRTCLPTDQLTTTAKQIVDYNYLGPRAQAAQAAKATERRGGTGQGVLNLLGLGPDGRPRPENLLAPLPTKPTPMAVPVKRTLPWSWSEDAAICHVVQKGLLTGPELDLLVPGGWHRMERLAYYAGEKGLVAVLEGSTPEQRRIHAQRVPGVERVAKSLVTLLRG